MRIRQMADAVRYLRITAAEFRETFLIQGPFSPGTVRVVHVDPDRTVIGSAVPTNGPLELSTCGALSHPT